MGHGPFMSGGMGVAMIIFWIIVLIAIIAMVTGILSDFTSSRRSGAHSSEAEEILRQRYAKGEIDKATFDSMRRDLQDG